MRRLNLSRDSAIAALGAFLLLLFSASLRSEPPKVPASDEWSETLAARSHWWSLQPIRAPAAPRLNQAEGCDSPIDAFIVSKLSESGLQLADRAEPRTLIRRACLVLTGLPPTREAIAEFLGDASALAYEKMIDRLLASPHFGERWARHWLDVVRFSETHGNEWNYEVHHAWRYRDYLIRAYNEDLPFDAFLREHVAGDLLSHPRWNRAGHFNESVIGTAFFRFGEVPHDDCIDLPQIGYDIADNQLDTLTKAFQATTVACARCHDHKLDAISMKDYYALLGVLRSSRQVSHTIDSPALYRPSTEQLKALKRDIREELSQLWQREALEVGYYLLAAQQQLLPRTNAISPALPLETNRLQNWFRALTNTTEALEEPLSLWRAACGTNAVATNSFQARWQSFKERLREEAQARAAFHQSNYWTFADFRTRTFCGWQSGGIGLGEGASPSGEIIVQCDGETAVEAILPAGAFTHTLSKRLNGTLRSPALTNGTKKISFQVIGRRSSALRLVSNNCQLNYRNYRALTNYAFQWVTFAIPPQADSLRVYAELMTMLDNPKFPDQLSGLGGDKENYKLPWEKAAADPRSFFGITHVVVHATDEPPKPDLTFLDSLLEAGTLLDQAELAQHYAERTRKAVAAWRQGPTTADDALWLDWLLQRRLLTNHTNASPRLSRLLERYREIEWNLPSPRITPGLADFGDGISQPLFNRGDCTKPIEVVPRRNLAVLGQQPFAPYGSGRLQLAEQMVSKDNPLTARVQVNRLWQHVFGEGLVRTVDDFGHLGELPSHPELLDYLADRFVNQGWSVKRMVRELVLTRTFRASSKPSPAAQQIDPLNRLLSHYPARRLEAEGVRDSILFVAGMLDDALYGMSIQPFREKENADRRLFPGPLDGKGRRSLYIKANLMESPKFLCAFNLPIGKVAQGRRDASNVPSQALTLLNDPFVLHQAGAWAAQVVARRDLSFDGRIDWMFESALGRLPTLAERKRCAQTIAALADLHGVAESDRMSQLQIWQDLAHALFNLKEFIFIN